MYIFLGTLFIVICVLLIVVVLLQKGRGGGLGSAFGGAGSSAFGTRTGDVFTWVTIVLTALFLLMSAVTTILLRPPPSVVAPVEFYPAQAVILGPTGITMACRTAGATIHYTTDRGEPSEESPAYEKTPVEVRPGITLTAKAFKTGWEASPMVRVTYMSTSETAPSGQQAAPEGMETPATSPAEGPPGAY